MGLFKSIKKAVKSVTKEVKRTGKKIDKEVRRNPGGWAGTVLTGGANVGTRVATDTTMKGIAKLGEMLTPDMPSLPDMSTPTMPSYGATQMSVQGTPTIDLGGSESRRRQAGAAKGTRGLRVPLGGL